jgi:aminopeptidase N
VHFRQEVPHSSYLVTLVAGEYTELRERAGEVELHYFVNPGREADAPRTFGNTGKMIELFAEKTGRAYPWPRYAQITVAEFIFGGMENTSATTLTDQTLHDARAHLDFSSEPLISHELAHQWFGDDVSVHHWSDIWLNEGFASFVEWKYDETHGGTKAQTRLLRQYREHGAGSGFWKLKIANPGPARMFDYPVYDRGAMALQALRHRIGNRAFMTTLRAWVADKSYGNGSIGQFQAVAEQVSGQQLDGFFDAWLRSSTKPARTASNGLR